MHIYKQVCFINKYHYNSKLPIVGYIYEYSNFFVKIYMFEFEVRKTKEEKRE